MERAVITTLVVQSPTYKRQPFPRGQTAEAQLTSSHRLSAAVLAASDSAGEGGRARRSSLQRGRHAPARHRETRVNLPRENAVV